MFKKVHASIGQLSAGYFFDMSVYLSVFIFGVCLALLFPSRLLAGLTVYLYSYLLIDITKCLVVCQSCSPRSLSLGPSFVATSQ